MQAAGVRGRHPLGLGELDSAMRPMLGIVSVLASTIVLAQGGRGGAPPPPMEPGASQGDVDKALLAAPPTCRATRP